MKQSTLGRKFVTIAGVIVLAGIVMMLNRLPIGDLLDRFGFWPDAYLF